MKPRDELKILILDSVILAIREDVAGGDITTLATVAPTKISKAKIVAKQDGIICGLNIAQLIFQSIDKGIQFDRKVREGASVKKGTAIATLKGHTRGLLTAERTALNYVQRLSGIATLTRKYVKKTAQKKVKVLDTRKTTPGLRALEKYAVAIGGGVNHRLGLFDAILIKDNHIKAAGGITKAVTLCRNKCPNERIEVEAGNIPEVKEAISCGVERIMLDNMDIAAIKKAVKAIRRSKKYIEIEVSGGIDLNNISSYASAGVDFISVGALTHSASALDINMKII
jgi:nicotinate-nucleotide pyrophosphorylase (carboxylating)